MKCEGVSFGGSIPSLESSALFVPFLRVASSLIRSNDFDLDRLSTCHAIV